MDPMRLCAIDELPEGASLSVAAPIHAILLARRQGTIYAWLDRCPHTGLSLRWDPRPFATADGRFLECASHGALFRVSDGFCIRGPCQGDRLTPLSVQVRDGAIWLEPDAHMNA